MQTGNRVENPNTETKLVGEVYGPCLSIAICGLCSYLE